MNSYRLGALVPILLLLVSGCATKEWVNTTLAEKEVAVNQRFDSLEGKVSGETQRVDTIESRVGETAQRVEGVGSRVQTLETSVGGVKDDVKAARERADTASSKADEVNNRLTSLWAKRNTRTSVETIEVQFGFDRWEITDKGQNTLMTLVKELKENDKLVVELQGYADPTGPRDYNVQLSQRRVESVRRFLVEKGVDLWRIQSVGMGPLLDKEPNAKKRRVTVVLASLE